MGTNLLYTEAFGGGLYFACAELMFRSARLAGFSGKLAAICDRDYQFDPVLGVTVHVHGADPRAKTVIHEYEVMSSFGRVYHADSDILFTKNPDDVLPQGDDAPPLFSCTGLPLKIFGFNKQYLTNAEIMALPGNQRCLNTSVYSLPAAGAAAFLRTWGEYHSKARPEALEGDYTTLRDQPALEALGVRGILRFELMPPEWMYWPATQTTRPPHENCLARHYTGFPYTAAGKARLLDAMDKDLKAMEAASRGVA